MKKSLRILSLTLAAVMLLTLTACGSKELVVRVVDSDGNDVIDAQDLINAVGTQVLGKIKGGTVAAGKTSSGGSSTGSAATATTAANGGSTGAGTAATTSASGGAAAATTAAGGSTGGSTAAGTPSTTADVVNLYNTAYAASMKDGTACARTYDYTSGYNDVVDVGGNSVLSKLASTLMGQFCKENTSRSDFSGNDQVIANIPPAGQSSTALAESDCASATCTDKGDTYEVTINLASTEDNPDVNPEAGSGVIGKICPIMSTSDIESAAASYCSFTGLTTSYFNGVVTVTIDKATNHITSYHAEVPCYLAFDSVTAMKVVKVSSCKIGLELHQTWEISY